jgi:hypothetical protein
LRFFLTIIQMLVSDAPSEGMMPASAPISTPRSDALHLRCFVVPHTALMKTASNTPHLAIVTPQSHLNKGGSI